MMLVEGSFQTLGGKRFLLKQRHVNQIDPVVEALDN
jgi:hypothetical protein